MSQPVLYYSLELTHEELLTLWVRFSFLYSADRLDEDDIQIYRKLVQLLEGR